MKAIRIGIWMVLWMGMIAVASAQDTTRLVKWQVSSKKAGYG
jgi:hypothetical protein